VVGRPLGSYVLAYMLAYVAKRSESGLGSSFEPEVAFKRRSNRAPLLNIMHIYWLKMV